LAGGALLSCSSVLSTPESVNSSLAPSVRRVDAGSILGEPLYAAARKNQ
jgi:hypothetical protein